MISLQEIGSGTTNILISLAVALLAAIIYGFLSSKKVIVIKTKTVLATIVIALVVIALLIFAVTKLLQYDPRREIPPKPQESGPTIKLAKPRYDDRTASSSLSVDGKASGTILAPGDNDTASGEFRASGTIDLPNGAIGWVAIRKGRLYWPKEPAIERSGDWQVTVFEGGPGGRFDLVLIAVDASTNEEIERRFDRALQTGSYPGMTLESRSVLLDSVNVTKR